MKKNLFTFLILSLLQAGLAFAEEETAGNSGLSFSGYFENQGYFRYNKNNEKFSILDYNKLRLDIQSNISEKVTFNADLILMTYHGNTNFNVLDFLPESIKASVPEYLSDRFVTSLEDTYFVNDAYITLYLEGLSIRIGKQQIPWGTGYTWNPTDNFHSKNQLDPTYEKEGVNAMTLDIPLGPDGSLTAVAATREQTENPSFAVKLKKNILGFDISGSWQYISEMNLDPETFTSIEHQRNVIGFDFTGELFDLGFWGEGTFNIPTDDVPAHEEYTEALVGMDYTFTNELYIMFEYLHRSQGVSEKEKYNYFDFLKTFFGETTNIGSDYLVCGINYPASDFIKLQLYSIFNLNDSSWILIPWIVWDASENFEIDLSFNFFLGDSGSEYGEYPHGCLLRFRTYF